MPTTKRILVVANRTASTPILLDEVTRRAKRAAPRFTLLIPPEKAAHEGDDWSLEHASALLARACGEPVKHLDCGPDAFDSIHRAVDAGAYDEIILSTPPEHLSRWIHHDLRHRLEHLGLPVRVIPPEPDAPLPAPATCPSVGATRLPPWDPEPTEDRGGASPSRLGLRPLRQIDERGLHAPADVLVAARGSSFRKIALMCFSTARLDSTS